MYALLIKIGGGRRKLSQDIELYEGYNFLIKKPKQNQTKKLCGFWLAILKFLVPWSVLKSFCPQSRSFYFAILFLFLYFFTFLWRCLYWCYKLDQGGHFSITLQNIPPSWVLAGSARWSQTTVWVKFLSGKMNSGRCTTSKCVVREGDQPCAHIK